MPGPRNYVVCFFLFLLSIFKSLMYLRQALGRVVLILLCICCLFEMPSFLVGQISLMMFWHQMAQPCIAFESCFFCYAGRLGASRSASKSPATNVSDSQRLLVRLTRTKHLHVGVSCEKGASAVAENPVNQKDQNHPEVDNR